MRSDKVVVDTEVAARYAGVSPATIRSWAHRPTTGVRRYPTGYDLAELDAYLARRNTRMIRARAAAAVQLAVSPSGAVLVVTEAPCPRPAAAPHPDR